MPTLSSIRLSRNSPVHGHHVSRTILHYAEGGLVRVKGAHASNEALVSGSC